MGLFDRLYYGKAGKRDYSEMDMPKNRVSLFFPGAQGSPV